MTKGPYTVFLGGTINGDWRNELIRNLESRGIDRSCFHNPVIEEGPWDDTARAQEEALKADPSVLKIFRVGYFTKNDVDVPSFYSGIEATLSMCLYPKITAILFDFASEKRAEKRMRSAMKLLQETHAGAAIFDAPPELEEWLFSKLTTE